MEIQVTSTPAGNVDLGGNNSQARIPINRGDDETRIVIASTLIVNGQLVDPCHINRGQRDIMASAATQSRRRVADLSFSTASSGLGSPLRRLKPKGSRSKAKSNPMLPSKQTCWPRRVRRVQDQGLQADFAQKRDKLYTREALDQTTRLLDLNPEFYTIWNYRRYILLKGLFPQWCVKFPPRRAGRYSDAATVPRKTSSVCSRPSSNSQWRTCKSTPKYTGSGTIANGVSRTYRPVRTIARNGGAGFGKASWRS